jgi:peptidoglycan/LPS O-acetylase OafA/YrhL
MNWFQRHLNWTMVLVLAGLSLLITIPGVLIAFTRYDIHWLAVALIVKVFIPLIVAGVIITAVWVLRRKKRSLWWLLMILVPLGFIVWLCLKNKNDEY